MKNSTRFAVLMLGVLVGLTGGAGSAGAGGNLMGGTGLYLTHSAETLAPGALRVGAFGQYLRYVLAEDPLAYDLAPQLAWSPAGNLELMFAMPLLHHLVTPDGKETGSGDGVVGLKYRLFPQVAALGYVSLPFGDESRSLGSGGTDVGFAGIVSFPLGAGVKADVNAGYQLAGVSGTAGDNFLFYGLGISVPVRARTTLFGEVAGRSFREGQSQDTVQFDLGLRHRINDRTSLTVGGGRGTRGDYGPEDSRLRLFAGFEFLFGVKSVAAAAPAAAAPAVVAAPVVAAKPVVAPAVAAVPAIVPAVVAAPVAATPAAVAAPVVAAPTIVAVPLAAAAAHTAQELDAAKKRLAATEILFEYDRTRLTPEGERALKQIIEDMIKYPEISFAIEGHADNRGTSSYNKILGLRRAEMVMRAMVKAGVGFGRLKVVTQGEMKPKVPNKDARGMALNRRVVFSAL